MTTPEETPHINGDTIGQDKVGGDKVAGDKITIMMDGGIRSGSDVARCVAAGARFTFMGRPFMYGVGALGKRGGHSTIAMLKVQLQQVMEQLGCEGLDRLSKHLIRT